MGALRCQLTRDVIGWSRLMWAEHAVNHRAKPTLKTNHPIHKTVIKYYIVAALFIQTDGLKRYNFCPQCDILIVRLDNASNIEITVRIGLTEPHSTVFFSTYYG